MARFTAVFHDNDQDEEYIVVCSARSADDVEKLCRQWQFDQSVQAGDTDWDAIENDASKLDDSIVDMEMLAVFAGDHPNLIVSDANFVTIPENWKFEVPPPK